MKKIFVILFMIFFFTNSWSDNIEQGAQKYDWQACVNDKSSECLNGCANSESLDCSDNCNTLAADKCLSEGVVKP